MKKSYLLFTVVLLIIIIGSCADSGGQKKALDLTEVVRSDTRPNVIFIVTDDQGFADLSVQGVLDDIKTPYIDKLAAQGVRMTNGYVTAPQCTPSRAAIITGRYQQKFGVDDNRYSPLPLTQSTLANRLSDAGYKTGMVGKWHLEIDANSKDWYKEVYSPGSTEEFTTDLVTYNDRVKYYPESRGFDETFFGYINKYRANYNTGGYRIDYTTFKTNDYRVDVKTEAALSFIDNNKSDPFFLYLSYFAPHVPLEATEKYLARFPGEMPERRRYALAMMSAVDDGVGRIMERLEDYGLEDDTIVFFISDNGAPLYQLNDVSPVTKGGSTWDGSRNDPWIGEKGMLTEGAVRVPYIVKWKGHLPEGVEYHRPVISIDATATAAHLANVDYSDYDGVNLIPYLNDSNKDINRSLYWRFWSQSAIRKGQWKYLQVGSEEEYLFNLDSPLHESKNLLDENPQVVAELRADLTRWAETLKRPGLVIKEPIKVELNWYDYYLNE